MSNSNDESYVSGFGRAGIVVGLLVSSGEDVPSWREVAAEQVSNALATPHQVIDVLATPGFGVQGVWCKVWMTCRDGGRRCEGSLCIV